MKQKAILVTKKMYCVANGVVKKVFISRSYEVLVQKMYELLVQACAEYDIDVSKEKFNAAIRGNLPYTLEENNEFYLFVRKTYANILTVDKCKTFEIKECTEERLSLYELLLKGNVIESEII